MLKKTALPLAIFLALAGLFWLILHQMNTGVYDPRDIPSQQIGKPAPDFTLPSLQDQAQLVRPADYRGQVWLLNVWGTWCPECWREHAFLIHLAERGIPIIGLNWRDNRTDALQMLRQLGNPFLQVAFDPHSQAAIEWGVYGAPETFLIDADGIIRARHKGALNASLWQQQFAPFFSQK
jgi:cytochrome c biogenesis protein CcmG/thiol:disulfide interchange protein DsbE